jgi:hypothetical protein
MKATRARACGGATCASPDLRSSLRYPARCAQEEGGREGVRGGEGEGERGGGGGGGGERRMGLRDICPNFLMLLMLQKSYWRTSERCAALLLARPLSLKGSFLTA